MTEKELVISLINHSLQRAGHDTSTILTNRNYEEISNSIEEKTGVLISVSTLKRLLNGQFKKIPQVATLNALAQYIDYAGWSEYRKKQKLTESHIFQEAYKPVARPNRRKYTSVLFTLSFVAIAGFGFILLLDKKPKTARNTDNIKFSMEKTTANSIPNSVVFNYNIDDVEADSFFIQQSWDKNRKVRIYKKNYTLTDIYYEPGYHVAKLIANEDVIKTVGVSIPTDRWIVFSKLKGKNDIPVYLSSSKFEKTGKLEKQDLPGSATDLFSEKIYVASFHPSIHIFSGDTYEFEGAFRHERTFNNPCPYFMIEVYSKQFFNFFTLTNPGCASNNHLQFGEKYLNGKNENLTNFVLPEGKWTRFKIVSENKHVTIFLDDKPIYELNYTVSPDLITGIGFISNDLFEVKDLNLSDSTQAISYFHDQ